MGTSQYRYNSESLWAGDYGDKYTLRTDNNEIEIACRTGNLAKCLSKAAGIRSSLEIGSNTGCNEIALQRLFPSIRMEVIEVNESAAAECKKIPNVAVNNCSMFDFEKDEKYDLTLVHGVLIYLESEKLREAYDILYKYSHRYVLIVEYYNPYPIEVNKDNPDRASFTKRDFCGEMLELYNDLFLLDYGFIYHKDPCFPMDDFNWFLLEKQRIS